MRFATRHSLIVLGLAATLALLPAVVADLNADASKQGAPGAAAPRSVASLPAFDTASVRLNPAGRSGGPPSFQPGGFTVSGMSVRALIQYWLRPFQVVGGPGWVDTDRFDVVARVPPGPPTTPDRILLMLQRLLSDRFELSAHREERELPVYALEPARRDGRLGPSLVRSSLDCAAVVASWHAAGADFSALAARKERPACIDRVSTRSGSSGVTVMFVADAKTMDEVAQMITPFVDRPVIGRTGLTGTFDVQLQFMRPHARSVDASPAAGDAPSLFTAVEEQLGLKLVSDRVPIEVMVIDSVERPTENLRVERETTNK